MEELGSVAMRITFLVLTGLLMTSTAGAATDEWREVKTAHFTIVGNAKEKQLRESAVEFEKIRSVFVAGIAGSEGVDPPVPVVIFVVKKEDDLRQLAPALWKKRKGPAGFFRNTGTQVNIAMLLGGGLFDSTDIAYHEYHHLLFDRGSPN